MTTPAAGAPPYLGPDQAIEDELARQYVEQLEAWYAWERAEWLRLEAERAEWLRLEAARAATAARPGVRAAPAGAITPGIVSIIVSAAERHGIDPVRFLRIAFCESGGDPGAWNRSGASGLFQQMPQYWAGRSAAAGLPGADPFDPYANAEVSAWLYATGGSSHWNPSRHCWG